MANEILEGGGPAFPTNESADIWVTQGMTLLDYFAAKALHGWRDSQGTTYEQDAKSAYDMAEAMLKEKLRRQ